MAKQDRDEYVPLAVACAQVHAPYWRSWRAVTSGLIPSKRDGRGFWYVRPEDLRALLRPMPVGGAV